MKKKIQLKLCLKTNNKISKYKGNYNKKGKAYHKTNRDYFLKLWN